MATDTALDERLQALERAWEGITDVPEMPRSTIDVVEYSLDDQRKAEVYVNRLLGYFLDPGEPHGMRTEFLEAFLRELPEGCGFQEDTYDLSDVSVDAEVTVSEQNGDGSGTGRTGRADLVLQVPNEWFLLVELKFAAGENNLRGDGRPQTVFYQDADRISGRRTGTYESGQYYLYLHRPGDAGAEGSEFANWTWVELTDDVLEELLATNAPRYPRRTVTQLREFVDDVRELSGMTDQQQHAREKVELYLEHYEAIDDVSETFDEHWKALADEWDARLGTWLAGERAATPERWRFRKERPDEYLDDQRGGTDHWTFLEAEPAAAHGDGPLWVFRSKDDDWGHLFKEGWWRDEEELANIYARDGSYEDVRVSFIHRFSNRDLAVGDRTLEFTFRNCGSNDAAFRERFNECFDARSGEIRDALPASAELAGQKRTKITATYDIRVSEHDGFFEAYVAALGRAFVDHAVENDELVDSIDAAFQDALAVYEGRPGR